LEYLGLIIVAILLLVVLPFFLFIYESPTCSDGLRNGEETGVDCGGSCRLLCPAEALPPIMRWDPRIFEITPGVYSVLAYVENPNTTAEVLYTKYTFKIYDSKGILITERKGETFIPKGSTFAVFNGNFSTGERKPSRATFQFDDNLIWTRNANPLPDILITNKALSNEETAPRVEATVENRTADRITNIELVAIIFDSSGNAIGSSRSVIEELNPWGSEPVVFTWPRPFATQAVACSALVDVAVVLDRSGSMRSISLNPPQPLSDVKDAAIFFINQLNDNDQAAVVSFADTASDPIESLLTNNLTQATAAIDGMSILSGGVQNTNIGDGLLKAMNELTSTRHNKDAERAIVMLTDGIANRPTKQGDPNYPENHALQVSNEAKSAGIEIFTVGLGKEVDAEFLGAIASSTNEYFGSPSTKELLGIYSNIATKLCVKRPAVIEIIPRIYPN
jgi:Mg-chelatase subunit ChlD